MNHQTYLTKTAGKLRSVFLLLLVTVFSLSGMVTANAATIKDDGKYSLVLQCGGWSEGTIDGETAKIVRFDVADGEDSVSIAELTKGIVPFDGEHEFSHWSTDFSDTSKADDEIPISKFTWSGDVYISDVPTHYENGFTLYGRFSDKPLKGTGTYYLNLDAFAGKVNGKSVLQMTSKSDEFKTVDLSNYVPTREGCNFIGWELNGEFVNKITAADFADRDSVTVTATYTTNEGFDDSKIHVTLDANGGTIDGKESAKYNYLGGGNSGTSMSLLPYVPVRNGYTFNGWNAKKDGSGKINYKSLYWRQWDKAWDEEFERDTLINTNGYERYLNATLYATWTKDPGHTHTYEEKKTLTRATTTKDGKRTATYICTGCKATYTKTLQTYYKVNNIKLNKTAYTYNGKVQKSSVTVKDSKGKTLKNGTDYKISYPKGMKNVGKYTVKVTLKGNYSGSKSMTYNINPKGTSVSKVTAAKKGFKVTWKKQATQTTGYQVQYSTSSKFKSAKTVTISKNKTTSKSVGKLSAKKKYYVRVRTYKTVKVNGKSVKLYSGWSKAKSVTTKK